MTDKIKYMNITEFRELGFLQEANRLFFHPLGLALEVTEEEDGTEHLSGIWDYREDPEGMIFAEGVIEEAKQRRVTEERNRHVVARVRAMGTRIQQVDSVLRAEPG